MANNLTFIDYHQVPVSADGETYASGLTIDGIHPSPQGYSLMTPAAEAAIHDAEKK